MPSAEPPAVRPFVTRRGCVMLLSIPSVIILLVFALFDRSERPICHKVLCLDLLGWQSNQQNVSENALPNQDGKSLDSLNQLGSIEMGDAPDTWLSDYRYVPGLNTDDPGDLVLVYRARPTRWVMHIPPPPLRWAEPRWIIIPPNFLFMDEDDVTLGEAGEMSFSVSEEEFRRRLNRTLEYLREQKRPHWETAVAEHQAFLATLSAASAKPRAR